MTRGLQAPLPTPPPGRIVLGGRDRNKTETSTSFNAEILAAFKTTPTVLPEDIRTARPMTGLCCNCLPLSAKELVPDVINDNGVCNILNVRPHLKDAGLLQRSFPVTAFSLQKRPHHYYPDMSMAVFGNHRLLEAIQKAAIVSYSRNFSSGSKDIQTLQTAIVLNAKRIFQEMKANISRSFINFTGWFLLQFLSIFLNRILVHRGQMNMVCNAAKKKKPMIYLPLHRSHLDYILITFILWNYKLRAPLVAAGDNLNIPFFSRLMKALGGFFIRRRLDKKSGEKDVVYRTLLHTYIEELLKHGEGLEFFIEGGRTRSGKVNLPKGGLLSIITETCSKGLIPDAYIVPISISYDKLIDGNFNREQMGLPKITENFWRATKAIFNVLMGDYGNVRLDFCQPFSLKEFLERHTVADDVDEQDGADIANFDSSPESSPVSVASYPCLRSAPCSNSSADRQLVQRLADHILHSATHTASFMTTNMLSFLLLTKHRSGATLSEISKSMEGLVKEVRQLGRDIAFCGDMKDAVHNGLSLLGTKLIEVDVDEINEDDICLKPNLKLPYVFELMYYSNTVLYVYLLDSVVASAAVYATKCPDLNPNSESSIEVTKQQILLAAQEICKLLNQEFVFVPPCKVLDVELMEVIESFISSQMLYCEEEQEDLQYDQRQRNWANTLCESLEWDVEEEDDDPIIQPETKYKLNLQQTEKCNKLRFLLSVIAPTFESYLTTANHINLFLKTETAEEDFILRLNQYAKSLAREEKLYYNESCAMDSLKICVKSFQQLEILDCCVAGNLRIVGLSEQFDVKDNLMHYIKLLEVIKTINTNSLNE